MPKAAIIGVSRLTTANQITISQEVREKLNVKHHESIQWLITEDGYVLIRKFKFDLNLR